MLQAAFFKFHHSLNDFLSVGCKDEIVRYDFTGTPAIKDAIEAIGVPHTEVDVIVVNGSPQNFFYKLTANDRVEVYPLDETPKLFKGYSLRPKLNYPTSFVADVHLGKLAKALRILGFDTIYKNDLDDTTIASIADKEQRIVLTRDVGLLKHNLIKWGYWLRSQIMEKQLEEVVRHHNLLPEVQLFKRCLSCNGKIEEITKEAVLDRLPPKTIQYFNEFFQCRQCRKIYWKGSHYENMVQMVKRNIESWDSKK